MSRKPKVLILTNKDDITADYVVLELQKRRVGYFRFNIEDFPEKVIGTFSLGDKTPTAFFHTPKGMLNLGEVSSIWYRRPGRPAISGDIADEGVRDFCLKECDEFLDGIWAGFRGLWVSSPPHIFRAQNKLYQLRLANDIGFKVPKTIITSDPEKVRAFLAGIRSKAVVKAVRQGVLTVAGKEHVIFTAPIGQKDMEALSDVKYLPSIFQEFIHKNFDLRVTVIGDDLFPVQIHTDPADPSAQFDWRRGDQEKLSYKIHQLPPSVEGLCRTIVRKMGLRFGAIDLVYAESGDYYFLEINPNGQWAWIEQRTGLTLTKSLVDLLVGGSI